MYSFCADVSSGPADRVLDIPALGYIYCSPYIILYHTVSCELGCPIFWSLSQKIKQFRGRSVGCVN